MSKQNSDLIVIGIDNGVSGALSILGKDYCYFTLSKTYIKKDQQGI